MPFSNLDRSSQHYYCRFIPILVPLLSFGIVDSLSFLEPLTTRSLPRLISLHDTKTFTNTHEFSPTANWLIPGHVMCGHYPGVCPSRPNADEKITETLMDIRNAGICTFVCLQDELPPQDGDWPEDGVPKKSERAPWATGNFQNYKLKLNMLLRY